MFGVVGLLAIVGVLADAFDGSSNSGAAPGDETPIEPQPNEINGTNGDNELVGTLDIDIIQGNGGDDTISGQGGDDTLAGGQGQDTIRGGAGADTILGGVGSDTIEGGADNDNINGGGNSDNIRGGGGNDVVLGGNGGDTIQGDGGDDVILGEAGNDLLAGGAGNDAIDGGTGEDDVRGGLGDDLLSGGLGADTISGGQGADIITGVNDPDLPFGPLDQDDGDVLNGNEGDDFIYIGSDDTANGGQGADRFASGTFVRPGEAGVIADFNSAEDSIQLHYDGTAGDAPAVTVVTNADGSASVMMGDQIVLNVTTPGDLAADHIILVDALTFDGTTPIAADPTAAAPELMEEATEGEVDAAEMQVMAADTPEEQAAAA